MLEDLHWLVHLAASNLFGRHTSSSSAAANRVEHARHWPLLFMHEIGWKHHQEPADSAKLEVFNRAVWSHHMASAPHDGRGHRKRNARKAGMSTTRLPEAAPEKRREVAVGAVSAARSPNVVDGRRAADGAHRPQEPADSARLGDFKNAIGSEHMVDMASAADDGSGGPEKKARMRSHVLGSPERREVDSGGVSTARSANAVVVARKVADAAHRRECAPERRETRAGEDAASTSARPLNGFIRSPSRSPAEPPVDDIFGDDENLIKARSPAGPPADDIFADDENLIKARSPAGPPADDIFGDDENLIKAAIKTHRQPPAPGTGKVHAGDQEVPSTSSPNPFGKPTRSQHRKPAEAAAATADDAPQENGGVDLYRLGLEAAMTMDDETILQEVAKYVGVEAHQQQRPRRRPMRQKKAAAAAKAPVFSIQLSDEEAMEEAAAVSRKDIVAEAEAPVSRKGKRRRG